jgi:hypothetical protein
MTVAGGWIKVMSGGVVRLNSEIRNPQSEIYGLIGGI